MVRDADRDPAQLAESRLTTAMGFLVSAELLASDMPKPIRVNKHDPAFYLLAGTGLELALKAALLHLGVPAREAEGYRHALLPLLQRAGEKGWPHPHERLQQIVDVLSETHGDHFWRYMDEGQRNAPSVALTLEVLNAVVNDMIERTGYLRHADTSERR